MPIPKLTYDEATAEAIAEAQGDAKTLYWGFEGDERYDSTDIDELIWSRIDDMDDFDVPLVLEAGVPRRADLSKSFAKRLVETILEALDEDHGDPDGNAKPRVPTDQEIAAAQKLVDLVCDGYTSYWLDIVLFVEIEDVHTWLEGSREGRELLAERYGAPCPPSCRTVSGKADDDLCLNCERKRRTE